MRSSFIRSPLQDTVEGTPPGGEAFKGHEAAAEAVAEDAL